MGRCLEAFPQVHGRIGTPGAPPLGRFFERLGGLQSRGFHQPQVARRKCVGPAQGAHRDILRGPRSDAGKLHEPGDDRGRVDSRFEIDLAASDGAGQVPQALGASARQAEAGKRGAASRGKRFGGGRDAIQASQRRLDRFTKPLAQSGRQASTLRERKPAAPGSPACQAQTNRRRLARATRADARPTARAADRARDARR